MRNTGYFLSIFLCIAVLVMAMAGRPIYASSVDDLYILEWDGLNEPLFYSNFVKKNGRAPNFTIFRDEDEALDFVLKNPNKYGVANICSYNIDNWLKAGVLKPWNVKKLENWQQIFREFQAQQSQAGDGNVYMVPHYFSYALSVYKAGLNKKYLQNLQSFIDPALRGQVGIIADGYYTPISLALLAVGVKDVSKLTDDQWAQAKEFLKKLKNNGAVIATNPSEMADIIVDKNLKLVWAFPDTAIKASSLGYDMKFSFNNSEGVSSYVCGHFLLKNDKVSEDLVYDYVNAANHQSVSSYMVNYWGWGHSNKVGMSKISKFDLLEYGLDDYDNRIRNSLFQKPVTKEWLTKFQDAYKDFIK